MDEEGHDVRISINLYDSITATELEEGADANIKNTLVELIDNFLQQYPKINDTQRACLARVRAQIIIQMMDFDA